MSAAVLHDVGSPLRIEELDLAGLRAGEVEVRVVLWLAADDSRHCTAQRWIVDGGWM